MESPKVVLCIPGLWRNRSELMEAIVRKSEGYMFAANYISKLGDPSVFFEVDIYEHDERVAEAFEIAGYNSFTEKDLDLIRKHSLTLYLIGDGGSIEKVRKLVDTANALVKAGGLGVKVESSGTANTIENWNDMYHTNDAVELFQAFVTVVEEEGFYYTCGMHCFGLPDVITFKDQVTPQYAQELMNIFCLYNLIEKPSLTDHSTFSIDANSPHFILQHTECRHFSEDELFYNQYGIWALVKKE